MENGKYTEAIAIFQKLDGYKDSKAMIVQAEDKIQEIHDEADYQHALSILIQGQWFNAVEEFKALGDYKDSRERIEEAYRSAFTEASDYSEAGEYENAIDIYSRLGSYLDASDRIIEIEKTIDYEAAIDLLQENKYLDAITALSELDSFRDSKAKKEEAQKLAYEQGTTLADNGNYRAAIKVFTALNDYNDSTTQAENLLSQHPFALAEVGDVIHFGAYEQNNNHSDGKEEIEWIVLRENNGYLFLISKYVLDYQKFYTGEGGSNWGDCTVRQWLNSTFLNSAFSSSEISMLYERPNSYQRHTGFLQSKSESTHDRVSLLTEEEVESMLSGDCLRFRQAIPTNYAKEKGVQMDGAYCYWMLRTEGLTSALVLFVEPDGDMNASGQAGGIRPLLMLII